MPKEKKGYSVWSLDTRKAEYCFSLSQSSGISTAGCKTWWWEQICMLWETTHISPAVAPKLLQGLYRQFKWENHCQCPHTHPQPRYPTAKLPHSPALEVLAPALPQHFSLQIWRTMQDPECVEGWCLCNASWTPASHQDCINTCGVILCFLYLLFYATFRIKMHHLAKGSGHETHFSHQSNAAFSYHHTTKAVRNLVFPFTPAVMQTPNACMAMLPMNSNGKSNKTTSSSAILSSIVFEQARQLLLYYSNICVHWHLL